MVDSLETSAAFGKAIASGAYDDLIAEQASASGSNPRS